MRKNKILIVLFTCIMVFASLTSCTFDYFEDETDYQVFVPEVLDNSIRDCRVMIYNGAGTLVGEQYAAYPWGKNPQTKTGLFRFRLLPGTYKVYCYTNTDSISFVDTKNLENSAFALKAHGGEGNDYMQPSDVFFHTMKPTIEHVGVLRTDTARIERYVGCVTVRFKKFPADVSRIKKVKMEAEMAATMQYLKTDTLTSFIAQGDIVSGLGDLPFQPDPSKLEVDHRFLPSVEGTRMRLIYTFLDSQGREVIRIPAEISDVNTGVPLRLLRGRRMIIEIESYTVVKIALVDWNGDIQSGGTNME